MGDQEFKDSVKTTLRIIGGKWKPVILCFLKENSMRFSELKREIPEITEKMLTQQLRELEQDGIIVRRVHSQVPPRVEYYLSEYGHTLEEVLDVMYNWGRRHQKRAITKGEST